MSDEHRRAMRGLAAAGVLGVSAMLGTGSTPAAVAAASPLCFGQTPTIYANTNTAVYGGTDGDDVIWVTGVNDLVLGNGGNDRICAESTNANLEGDGGNDRLLGNSGLMSGGAGDDVMKGLSTPDYRAAPRAIDADLATGVVTGWGTDTLRSITVIIGSAYGDTLRGGDNDDILHGDAGPDVIIGRLGGDVIDPGLGKDTVSGGGGDDSLFADVGTKSFDGGPGWDLVTFENPALTNPVTLDLAAGTASSTNIQLTLARIENANGGPAADTLSGDDLGNTIHGGDGNDDIHGLGGPDQLWGDAGDDTLYGDDGDDYLIGGGQAGDVRYGGAGLDQCPGGGTNDCENPS